MKAHGHYRAGEMKDAITDANNAFESTLKSDLRAKGAWQYSNGARASDLLKVVRENGLLPSYLDNSFDQLAATLKSGLPKVRGEEGAHGQGAITTRHPIMWPPTRFTWLLLKYCFLLKRMRRWASFCA